MPDTETPSPSRRSGVLSTLSLLAGLVIVVMICVPVFRAWQADKHLDAALTRLREPGQAQDLETLLGPPPAGTADAAPRYHRVLVQVSAPEAPYLPGESSGRPRPELIALDDWIRDQPRQVPPQITAILETPWVLAAFEAGIAAARQPACRFELQAHRGALDPQPHIANLLHLQTLFLAESVRAGMRGDPERCTLALQAALWLSRHLAAQPTFAAATHYAVLLQRACTVIEHAASHAWITPTQQVLLMAELQAHAELDLVPVLMRAERIRTWDWQAAQLLDGRRLELPGQDPAPISWTELATAKADIATWIDLALDLEPLLDQRSLERHALLHARLDAAPKPRLAVGLYHYTLGAGPALDAARQAHCQATLTRTGLAVLLYFRLSGALPASLDTLQPEILDSAPVDPSTGEPLVLEQHADRVSISAMPGEHPLRWSFRPPAATPPSVAPPADQ